MERELVKDVDAFRITEIAGDTAYVRFTRTDGTGRYAAMTLKAVDSFNKLWDGETVVDVELVYYSPEDTVVSDVTVITK